MKQHIVSPEHTRITISRVKNLKKPFGFCCDKKKQDPETQYDIRYSPFESSFAESPVVTEVPSLLLCIQNKKKNPTPIPRTVGVYVKDEEVKKATSNGRSKRTRGPLEYFLEDEIKEAREALAEEKKTRWEERLEKNVKKR